MKNCSFDFQSHGNQILKATLVSSNYIMYTGSRFVVKVILYRECMYDANWTCWSFQRNQQ